MTFNITSANFRSPQPWLFTQELIWNFDKLSSLTFMNDLPVRSVKVSLIKCNSVNVKTASCDIILKRQLIFIVYEMSLYTEMRDHFSVVVRWLLHKLWVWWHMGLTNVCVDCARIQFVNTTVDDILLENFFHMRT